MRLLETSMKVEAPPSEVWRLITDTRAWPEWGLSVRAVSCRDRYIKSGSTGHVQTAFGFWLTFEVTRFALGKEWAWRVGRMNATGHRVEAIAPDRCRVVFEVPVFAAPYLIVCAVAARRIKHLAEEGNKKP